MGFPREENPRKMIEWMKSKQVDYVLVSAIPYEDIRRFLIPAVDAEKAHFYPVFEVHGPYTVLLRFHP